MALSGSPEERAQHYRQEAAKLREMAASQPDPKMADQIAELAAQYDRLAERAEREREI